MKIFLRYKSISLIMIVVFTCGYMVFNYNMQAKLTEKFEYQDKTDNSYKYEKTILVTPCIERYDENADYAGYISAAAEQIDKEDINISMIDISPLMNEYALRTMANLYIGGMQPKYPLIKGEYPDDEIRKENSRCVVLGKNRKKYVSTENGTDYIYLDGEKYIVTGYISTQRSHYLDNRVIIYNTDNESNMRKSVNDSLKMGMAQIVFASDTDKELYNIADEFVEQIGLLSDGMLEANVISESESTEITTSYVPDVTYRRWAWLAYAFCMISDVFLLQYWIMQRKKEIVIKKIYGFSAFRILWDIFTETLLLMAVSVLLGEFFVNVSDMFSTGFAGFNIEIFVYTGLTVLGYLCISMMLVLIYPMIWLCRNDPVSLMSDKRR